MNPVQLSDNLKNTLRSYLTTIFDVNRDGKEPELADAIERSFDIEEALSNGPYLEITPPYATGLSLQELTDSEVLSQKLVKLPEENLPLSVDIPLYAHQEKAIRKLVSDQRNIVVSSGTGSGKTESFLIPILNDLLIDPSPGVRALLIYPLNALVNDQLDRLRTLLKDTDITFGRYTSELDEKLDYAERKYPNALPNEVIAREQIRSGDKIPQILITNYAMLEYLLLRPEDSELFASGNWKFVVLDEAHTYSGAQGIEVSMLLRRLKHRLKKKHGDMQCIATSATLTDDDTSEAIQFAENLFNETFEDDDIIFGELNSDYVPTDAPYFVNAEETYLDEKFDDLIEVIRNATQSTEDIAIHMVDIGLIPEAIDWSPLADEHKANPHRFVWEILRNNGHLVKLRDWMLSKRDEPVAIGNAAEVIFGSEITTPEEQKVALYHLIELGAIARPKPDAAPLLPARYHMFMRSPQGVWVCLNPECSGRDTAAHTGWSRVFPIRRDTCDSCGCKVFPISVCRECGQVYVKTKYKNGEYVSEPHHHANDLTPDYDTRYFIWSDLQEDRAFGADDETPMNEADASSDSTRSIYETEDTKLCMQCGYEVRGERCKCAGTDIQWFTTLKMVMRNDGKRDKNRKSPYEFMNECPRCRSSAQKGTEIATDISVSGTSPLATITYELYRELPTATKESQRNKPGQGRKLLTFYDSRQGAARFASYLQFTVNTDNYRHVIPTAINEVVTKRKQKPNLSLLTKKVREIAWNLQIFHNDMEIPITNYRAKPSRQQITELEDKINTQILGEVSTGRLRRQSLEALGLVAVHYFDDDDPEFLPDFADLASKLGLSVEQTRTLIEYFLDDLRKRKIIDLPEGVEASDESFGIYEGHPTLVRGNVNPTAHQQPWLGKTERHSRYRYMKLVLESANLPATDDAIKKALMHTFNWLIDDDNNIMVQISETVHRLKYDTLIFSTDSQWYRCEKCQRLHAHGNHLPCPHPHCGGQLQAIDIHAAQANNFFYQSFIKTVVPIRVEEHTAQLESDKGRDYQEKFRDGNINVLSCSTTFEMGIDLGDLQAVVMSNVPPTVANYRQRAGRAGRRAGGAAFILTWASDRPHDQTYFSKPSDIIRGQVRVPYIAIDNPFIQKRHINAILLSEFLRYRRDEGATDWKTIGSFFDEHYAGGDPHLHHLEAWIKDYRLQIEYILKSFSQFVENTDINSWIDEFLQDVKQVYEEYRFVSDYYSGQLQELQAKILQDFNKYNKLMQQYYNYQNRLREERMIDYFSSRGVLPSYSFPLHSVELQLPPDKSNVQLRLQRDLKVAIREYAPGSEIVADKRVWRSDGVQFYRDTVMSKEYRICETCNRLQISQGTGIPIANECPVCGNQPIPARRKVRKFIIPDGFFARSKDNGRPARQYVKSEPSLMRSALIPKQMSDEAQLSSLVSYAYDREGTLLYVNEGDVRYGGFSISLEEGNRGALMTTKKDRQKVTPVSLGHERSTDTLRLRFNKKNYVNMPSPDNMSFWISLMYALIQGASRALQIERGDIDGVLFPIPVDGNGAWEQTIVLYDNVPGGAGHVRQIQKEFIDVVREALQIANCTDCSPETSCYHCLRDFSNQLYHHILKRHDVVRFLEALLTSLVDTDSDIQGASSVVAIKRPLWLMQQIENAKSSVDISVKSITLDKPVGALRNWVDVLQELLRRNVEVTLRLQDFSIHKDDSQTLSIRKHLQLLQERGLTLEVINTLPEWQILIDTSRDGLKRAVQVEGLCILNAQVGEDGGLVTTTHDEGILTVQERYRQVKGKAITGAELEPPPTTDVINYDPRTNKARTERDLFSDIFSQPVKEIYINDRYLNNHEKIVERLGAYIQLAHEQGSLETVTINTYRVGTRYGTGTKEEQDRAIKKIKALYPDVSIRFKYSSPAHDRYIILTRNNSSKARILIGQGLDFIRSNGWNQSTYIVIEDPYT